MSFHHHDLVGAKLARKRLRALRFDNDTIAAVARLIELHLRFFGYADAAWTDSAVRRYVRDAGDQLERLHILTRADVTTRNRRKADRLGFAYDDLEERIAVLAEEEELAAVRPELDGQQIMALLDVKPGPIVGEAYRYLLEVRLDEGPIGPDAARRAPARVVGVARGLNPPRQSPVGTNSAMRQRYSGVPSLDSSCHSATRSTTSPDAAARRSRASAEPNGACGSIGRLARFGRGAVPRRAVVGEARDHDASARSQDPAPLAHRRLRRRGRGAAWSRR